jgi:hypothetical protein
MDKYLLEWASKYLWIYLGMNWVGAWYLLQHPGT